MTYIQTFSLPLFAMRVVIWLLFYYAVLSDIAEHLVDVHPQDVNFGVEGAAVTGLCCFVERDISVLRCS